MLDVVVDYIFRVVFETCLRSRSEKNVRSIRKMFDALREGHGERMRDITLLKVDRGFRK